MLGGGAVAIGGGRDDVLELLRNGPGHKAVADTLWGAFREKNELLVTLLLLLLLAADCGSSFFCFVRLAPKKNLSNENLGLDAVEAALASMVVCFVPLVAALRVAVVDDGVTPLFNTIRVL